jgi:hypothetical protein
MRKSILSALLLASLFVSTSVMAGDDDNRRLVQVSGKGSVTLPATSATVQLAVEATARTAREAQTKVAGKASAVVAFLKAEKPESLYTSGISLNPQYDYQPDGKPPVLRGFTASNSVTARLPVDKAGKVLDGAVQAGATSIQSLTFDADDARIREARLEAIRKAVTDARTQADAALDALGEKADSVDSIAIAADSFVPQPVLYKAERMMAMAADGGAAPSSPVMGQEQKVEVSVTLQVRY